MRLHRYFARKFAVTFLLVLGILATILALVDLMNQVGRYSGTGIAFGDILRLVALSTPETLYEFLPLVMILSSLALFLGLARSSELVVTRALGWSPLRVLMAPIAMSLMIGACAVAVFNPVISGLAGRYEALSREYRSGEEATLSLSADGLWLRQSTLDGQAVIHAGSANPNGSEFFGVTFMMFDASGAPSERIEAGRARLEAGYWTLEGAKDWSFDQSANPEAAATWHAALRIPTTLTPERIAAYAGAALSISIWDMRAYIAQLERAGFSTRRSLLRLEAELTRPLLLAAMVLIGAAFSMRHARSGRTGLMVLFAIMSGFSLYFVRDFALILGENGQIPVVLAAWAPPMAGLLLALGLILHLEDG
jgi:lipopolysaccharide export system permease protein